MRPATALVLLLATLPLAAALTLPSPIACEPICPTEDGYELRFADGFVARSHGADPVPGHLSGSWFPAAARAPACIEPVDQLTQRHGLVIYAHPADKPDRGHELAHELREMMAMANGLLHREAVERGAPGLDYRMACVEGELRVDAVTLPFLTGRAEVPVEGPQTAAVEGLAQYYRIVAALRALGYDSPMTKYWVWYDDPSACTCGGVADAPLDQLRTPNHPANTGANYALTFGYTGASGAFIMMHENGHNMGAVSSMAPESSGAGHCNDGQDIMCYADGGAKADYRGNVCTDRVYYDCNHDTYFDVRSEPGTFLAKRWNLAAPINRFVEGCMYEERLVVDSASIDVPAACQGARFAAFGEHAAPPAQGTYSNGAANLNEVDVCWYAGDALLRCDARGFYEEGVVPAGASRAVVTKTGGADARVTLSIV